MKRHFGKEPREEATTDGTMRRIRAFLAEPSQKNARMLIKMLGMMDEITQEYVAVHLKDWSPSYFFPHSCHFQDSWKRVVPFWQEIRPARIQQSHSLMEEMVIVPGGHLDRSSYLGRSSTFVPDTSRPVASFLLYPQRSNFFLDTEGRVHKGVGNGHLVANALPYLEAIRLCNALSRELGYDECFNVLYDESGTPEAVIFYEHANGFRFMKAEEEEYLRRLYREEPKNSLWITRGILGLDDPNFMPNKGTMHTCPSIRTQTYRSTISSWVASESRRNPQMYRPDSETWREQEFPDFFHICRNYEWGE